MPDKRRQIKWANDQQQWLFEAGPRPTLLYGGINSGKTAGCVLKALALLTRYEGSRLAVIRRTYSQLLKTTLETWWQWCHPSYYRENGRFNEALGILDLNNGSRVYFLHLDTADSLDVLAGLELNFGYVSQAEELEEEAWDLLDTRVGRWTGATIPAEEFAQFGGEENWPWRSEEGTCVPPRYLFAESYSTDEDHWLYRRFAEQSLERKNKWEALGYQARRVQSTENRFAIQATLDASLGKDEDFVRRYVRAEWGNPEEKMFRLDDASIIDPDSNPGLLNAIRTSMKLHRVMDHGETAPTCCLWYAVDTEGRVFFFREYYAVADLVSSHRKAIYELSLPDSKGVAPHYASNLADPHIFDMTRGHSINSGPRWSVASEWEDSKLAPRETAIFWLAADNNEEASRWRIKAYLHVDQTVMHPITGKRGAPRVYFIRWTPSYPHGCDMTITELRAQRRSVVTQRGDGTKIYGDERDDTVPDHSTDCVRYALLSRPQPAEIPQEYTAFRVEVKDGRSSMPAAALHRASRRAARLGR